MFSSLMSTPMVMFALSLVGVIGATMLGMPVAWALGLASAALIAFNGLPLQMIPHMMTTGVDVFVLLAIPLFILTGRLMNESSLTDRIYEFCSAVVGRVRGGLAYVNVLSSVMFAGMSGSALADIQGTGTVVLKAETDKGYSAAFSSAVTVSSAVIGPIIPPSIPFVVYAVAAEVSVGDMFLAGIVPGLLMAVSLMIYIALIAKRKNLPVSDPTTFRQLVVSFFGSLPALAVPVLLLASLIFGVATPTEIGVLAVGAILVLILVYWRPDNPRRVWTAVKDSARSTATVMVIVATASLYGKVLALLQVPVALGIFATGLSTDPLVFLFISIGLFLFLGLFLDTLAIMVVMLPVLLPTVKALGIDPVHFGVVSTLALMIGLITPPFGMALFAMSDISKLPAMTIAREALPFAIPLLVVLVLITIFPEIVMFVPNLAHK